MPTIPWWLVPIILAALIAIRSIKKANKKHVLAELLEKQHSDICSALRLGELYVVPAARAEDFLSGAIHIESHHGICENVQLIIESSSAYGKHGGTYAYIRHFYENDDYGGLDLSPCYLERIIIRILRDKYKLGELIDLNDQIDVQTLGVSLVSAVREFRSLYDLTFKQRIELKAARDSFHAKVTHFYSEGYKIIDSLMPSIKS